MNEQSEFVGDRRRDGSGVEWMVTDLTGREMQKSFRHRHFWNRNSKVKARGTCFGPPRWPHPELFPTPEERKQRKAMAKPTDFDGPVNDADCILPTTLIGRIDAM